MTDRQCVKEEYTETDIYQYTVKQWILTYSDGTAETLVMRVRK